MTDNLFEQLFELFQQPGPVNWKLASEIAKPLTGPADVIEPKLADEYQELALAAQLRISPIVPFDVPAAELHPVDRRTWADANQQSWRFLIEPLAALLESDSATPDMADPMSMLMTSMGPALLGMQAGSMVGYWSQRTLGQFDVGLPGLDHADGFLIVPNVESFATDHSLDPRQVRMWAALHEVTHGALLNLPWMRSQFRSLIDGFYDALDFDPSGVMGRLGSMEDPSAIQDMLSGETAGFKMFGGAENSPELARLQGLIAFIEGYGDYVVEQAGTGILADHHRIATAHQERRAEDGEGNLALSQLVGLELQRIRAGDAARFCTEVGRRWGPEALEAIFTDADKVPLIGEITDPVGWAARVLL